MESKPNELKAAFAPRVMGCCFPLIFIIAFAAGSARQELALILAGAVFLALWAYSLIMILTLALLHISRVRHVRIRVCPCEAASGESIEAVYSGGRVLELPGIVVRCRLLLAAKDGRRITYDFNPAALPPYMCTAAQRGAYFSAYDELAIFDVLGLFRFAFRLPPEHTLVNAAAPDSPRLLVSPRAAEEPLLARAHAGVSSRKPEFSLRRSDDMTDHRPYVPGDDPRRINWKLYGHGGGLFVRDGEYEPPPQSNIVILIDTEYDPVLYSKPEARRGIDTLCENALAAAAAFTASGMNVLIGYPGGIIRGGNITELGSALAWPAALPLSAPEEFPTIPHDRGILALALPRSSAATSILDRFLQEAHARSRTVELFFICGTTSNVTVSYSDYFAAAEFCAVMYNRRQGVRARVVGV